LLVPVLLRRVCIVLDWLPGIVAGLNVPGVRLPLVVPVGLVLRLPEVVPFMVPGTTPGVAMVPEVAGLLFRLPGVVTPAGVPSVPAAPGVTVVPGVVEVPGVVCAKAVVLRPKPSRAAPHIFIVFIVVTYRS
jgi:hypothetical protein